MKQRDLRLTAVIIAKNEAPRITKAIQGLSFAGRVVVIDNGSTDGTDVLAKAAGATLVHVPGDDFSALRNQGMKEAGDGWILYVDADEQVSPELKRELLDVIEADEGKPVSYRISRVNTFLGKPWPANDTVHRVFSPGSLIRWEGAVHESPVTKGEIRSFQGLLSHDTHRSLEQMVDKTNEWSAIEAKLRFDAGHPPVVAWRLVRVFITGFLDSYIGKGGYKAGAAGMIESIFQGFSLFVTYSKLWELQEHKGREA